MEVGCEICSELLNNHRIIRANMKQIKNQSFSIYVSIRNAAPIYEDFYRELSPFLIRNDLLDPLEQRFQQQMQSFGSFGICRRWLK